MVIGKCEEGCDTEIFDPRAIVVMEGNKCGLADLIGKPKKITISECSMKYEVEDKETLKIYQSLVSGLTLVTGDIRNS